MAERRPFRAASQLPTVGEEIWQSLSPDDWKEAFSHHPKIGDIHTLRAKFANTKDWAEGEQAGVKSASNDVLQRLAEANRQYEEKFGYIFIVCATRKSAEEMLRLLRERLNNDPSAELPIAAEEQRKITRLRLEKILTMPQ